MLKNAFIELLSPPATKKNESIYKNNSGKMVTVLYGSIWHMYDWVKHLIILPTLGILKKSKSIWSRKIVTYDKIEKVIWQTFKETFKNGFKIKLWKEMEELPTFKITKHGHLLSGFANTSVTQKVCLF